jgi:MoaE-MoaD fusion protein
MRVKVLYFAQFREVTGKTEEVVEVASTASARDLLRQVLTKFPALSPLETRIALAVNRAVVQGGEHLEEGDEVAFLSPLSGGWLKTTFGISQTPIDLSLVNEATGDSSCGGHALFLGTVRRCNEGREVIRLEYEAYAPMAEEVFREIGEEAADKFGIRGCRIIHRSGVLEPGELSVVVAISSEHRKEAFRACEYVVNELKHRAPIWKKEIYRDGTSEWLGGDGKPRR